MTDRDRETLVMPWQYRVLEKLGSDPVVIKHRMRRGGKPYRYCSSHHGVQVGTVLFLQNQGALTLQDWHNGVAVYVRAGTGEPKAAWAGGI